LGSATPTSSPTPVALPGSLSLRSISSGADYACGLTTLGTAYCWGADAAGNLGNGTHDTQIHAPSTVVGGTSWQTLSAGEDMTCGVASTGDAYCWGSNLYDLVANGTAIYHSDVPALAFGGLQFRTISSRGDHACALTTDGVVYCWGAYVS
jgi:alpha-tubulin suppressor-like RCC1 family protein